MPGKRREGCRINASPTHHSAASPILADCLGDVMVLGVALEVRDYNLSRGGMRHERGNGIREP
jgi:hypothetical protein